MAHYDARTCKLALSLLPLLLALITFGFIGRPTVVVAQAPPTAQTLPPSPTPTLRPGVWRVTPAPKPKDVLEAATRLVALRAELTRRAQDEGVSYRVVTTTYTPAPLVVTNTPTPGNGATATRAHLVAEARALTTGTPTPLPAGWVTATPQPTVTAAPLFVLLSDKERLHQVLKPTKIPTPTPRAMPQSLVGKIAFRSMRFGGRMGQGRILCIDPDGENLAYMPDPWAYEVSCDVACLSPDRRYTVYQNDGAHGLDLFLAPSDGSSHQRLTFVGRGKAYDMAWSPDGWHIAFASNQEGDDDIYVVELPGLHRNHPYTVKLTDDDGWQSDKRPSFSPDGAQIVFHSNRSGRNQIWLVNADGTNLRQLTDMDADCWAPVWLKGLP